ncbi:MAG: BACON domain-containing protein [Bacteroidaceae bacterium]|nr:BACON domain-containing protein [Bacteroidaceae bacterium]
MKKRFFSRTVIMVAAAMGVGLVSCHKDNNVVIPVTLDTEAPLSVSATSVSMLSAKNSTATVTVIASGGWTLTGCPDWINASASSGNGTTPITLTALSENWSDENRSANLVFNGSTSSATVTVSQLPSLPPGLRVETLNMTLMSDGFACDLQFGPETKGYREAFFTESSVQTMTDRDIYNKLMEQTEYSGRLDYTFLDGWADPGTRLVYCVAAYGNESNEDGSHKYGPITIERITTRARTIYDDMYLTASYNSSRWTVIASRQGSYGQRCDEYYYVAAEDDLAEEFNMYSMRYTYALMAHLVFKPEITADRNWNYCNGPQTMNWTRGGNKFFCTTWGIDRDTRQFSAELSTPVYLDLSSPSAPETKRVKSNPADWNKPHQRPTPAEIMKMRNSLKVFRVSK